MITELDVEFIRRMCWNIKKYIEGLDRNHTTYLYSMMMLDHPGDGKKFNYVQERPIRILLVCNRYNWAEYLDMFGIRFLIMTTDYLRGFKDLENAREMSFELEESFAKSSIPGH